MKTLVRIYTNQSKVVHSTCFKKDASLYHFRMMSTLCVYQGRRALTKKESLHSLKKHTFSNVWRTTTWSCVQTYNTKLLISGHLVIQLSPRENKKTGEIRTFYRVWSLSSPSKQKITTIATQLTVKQRRQEKRHSAHSADY